MINQSSSTEQRPWYREPWPWLLMAGPALAVVGCVITIYLAMTRFVDEPIYDGGSRRGLVVERGSLGASVSTPALRSPDAAGQADATGSR